MLDKRNGQYYEYLLKQNIPLLDSGIKSALEFSPTIYLNLKEQFNNYDIIHLHSFSTIRSLAAIKSKAKIVYTIHGLSKGVRKDYMLKYFLRESLKKYFLNKVDVFVANSKYTLSLAKKALWAIK